MATFFTSDTHFGHANIIKYAKRPFAPDEALLNWDKISAAEKREYTYLMDQTLTRNWNAVVSAEDIVYHLGDFAVGGKGHFLDDAAPYLRALNGKIHFIAGNHDTRAYKIRDMFASYNNFREIKVDGQGIVLCHYAMRVWNKAHHGYWQLYGHSHGSLADDPYLLSCDVGVDCWNFAPVSMAQLRERMAKKTWKPVDHHDQDCREQESGKN